MSPPSLKTLPRHRARQRGAATLVVVMLLFFVLSLAAAYAGRNLIFEQRTSANQYQSTQSFEVAEAGLEWAITLLNGGRIDTDCAPTNDVTLNTFRQRYLSIDPATGNVTRNLQTDGSALFSACVFNGAGWNCSCPTDGAPAPTVPAGAGAFPAFGVRFVNLTSKPGLVRVEVNGCTAYDATCVSNITPNLSNALCRASVCATLALHSGLKTPPVAAVTTRGSVTGTTMTVTNGQVASGGVTVHSGALVTAAGLTLVGPPGTPGERTLVESDAALAGLSSDTAVCRRCLFASVFNLWPDSYRDQQSVVRLNCGVGGCTAATVAGAVAVNPGRMMWLEGAGGLQLDSNIDIGSAGSPVVVVSEGPVTTSAANARVFGLVYAPDSNLSMGQIQGALVSPTNVAAAGTASVVYDNTILDRIRLTQGSFVRIPGSWRDFP